MKPGLTATRVKSKSAKKPKTGTAHNRDNGMGALIAGEVKRKGAFNYTDIGVPDKQEAIFLKERMDTPENYTRAIGVIKKVRKMRKDPRLTKNY